MDFLNVLIVESDEKTREMYTNFFKDVTFPKFRVTYITDVHTFQDLYREKYFNLAIIDYILPDGNGSEIVHSLKYTFPQCYVTVVSSLTDANLAMELVNAGVDMFLQKPVVTKELQALLNFAYDKLSITYTNLFQTHPKVQSPDIETAEVLTPEQRPTMIFESSEMAKFMNKVERVALSDSTILITGESGCGKELIAQTIHSLSKRRKKPLVTINIAALPETLIESELFGYKKGAFTDAKEDRPGRFAEAEGGTIFIDEIGDIPLTVQVKLLRVLQFKQYQRIGENRTYNADVRILGATSQNVKSLIEAKQYREDFYYRISVITLRMPALRERRSDILPLINFFIERISSVYGKKTPGISAYVLQTLQNYRYPGNIRELENILEHAVVMCRGIQIEMEDLPEDLALSANEINQGEQEGWEIQKETLTGPYEEEMKKFEQDLIETALRNAEGNQSEAARCLGINERKLRYRLQLLGMQNTYRIKG